ncbi:MAG: phosphoribosylamine--glycine ligase, partial [Bacteroidota bacterium]
YFENDPSLADVMIIGPGKSGARLEGSKDFSKQFMFKHGIPTAKYATFTANDIDKAYIFLDEMKAPYVLKADGLAAGKGVLILNDLAEAKRELHAMLVESKFGNASSSVVIEEFLTGIELSVFVLTDGQDYVMLPEAKDYKRIGEGDTGLNTGGMGAVSPVPFADADFMKKVEERIVKPTVKGLSSDNIPYTGFIFIGLMNVGGNPFVIEYNVRMGDPETEAVIPRIKNDLVQLFVATAQSKLHNERIKFDERTAITVILASGGYPGEIEKGKIVNGLSECADCLVFHSGTSENNHQVVTSGGRVFAITALSESFDSARKLAMECANKIKFEGKYYRKDIGNDLEKWM